MQEVARLGLEVIKETVAGPVSTGPGDPRGTGHPQHRGDLHSLLRRHRDPRRLLACYEAGPTGYDRRQLSDLGVGCDDIAPTLIRRRARRWVKDRPPGRP